jgi:uncharacterized membrane protein (UPF0182 family)
METIKKIRLGVRINQIMKQNIFETIGSKSEDSRFIYSISFTSIRKVLYDRQIVDRINLFHD